MGVLLSAARAAAKVDVRAALLESTSAKDEVGVRPLPKSAVEGTETCCGAVVEFTSVEYKIVVHITVILYYPPPCYLSLLLFQKDD